MRKAIQFSFLLIFIILSSCNNGVGDQDIVVLKLNPQKIKAKPDKGFNITYRWKTQSPRENDSVFVRILDKEGKVILTDDHIVPSDAGMKNGIVEYSRLITLPVWEIKNKKTYPAVLPEGEYKILSTIKAGNGEKRKLKRGPGVRLEGDSLYRIGTLVLDKNAPVPDPGEVTLDLSDYRLTFNEEFDDLSVSAWGPCGDGGTRWIAHTAWNGDFGDAEFVDPEPGFPFTVKDGILRIEARKINGEWKSGLLSAADPNGNGFDQTYGYFECRAKFPQGPGTWPAFWLMGKKNLERTKQPVVNPEVDIVEHYGHWPNRFSYVLHLWGRRGAESVHNGKRIKAFGVEEDFHTYGVLINEDYIIHYFDGVEKDRMKTPDAVKVPLYPIVNLALGPGWPTDKTPDPSFMYVDYVRVYSK